MINIYHTFELRDEERKVMKTTAVIDATFAIANRKPEKVRLVGDSNP